jgi:hypothetical protein
LYTMIYSEHMNKKAILIGMLVGALVMGVFLITQAPWADDTHPAHSDEVHVHADFLIVIDNKKIDLTADKFQTKAGEAERIEIHLHDNQGNIIHRHAEDITLAEFLGSIGFELTESCLTLDTGEKYCQDETNSLTLYVNKESRTPLSQYVTNEADQVLLYYGNKDSAQITQYLNEVTDEACIYTGTCPERGTPPPEACGLTCEI